MVTRRDLRAERDFYSPMTGGTQIRYADAPKRQDTYSSEVKKRLSDIKNVKSTRVNPIEAIFAKLQKTEDPFTQIEEKKSYAPQEENDFMGALEGAAGAAQDAIGEGVAQVQDVVRSTGQRASERRAAQQLKRKEQRAADQANLDKRFSGVETGLSNLGKDYKQQELDAIDRYNKFKSEQSDRFAGVDKRFGEQLQRDIQQDIATRKTAQDQKTYEQNRAKQRALREQSLDNRLGGIESGITGVRSEVKAYETNREKQRRLTQSRLKGVESGLSNLGSDYKAQEQRAIDNMTKFRAEQANKFSGVDKRIGGVETQVSQVRKDTSTTFGGVVDLKKSLSEIKARQDAKTAPKQVSNLPSDYKATEASAIAAAKAYRSMTSGANVGSGAQANIGTGKDGNFGTGTYGKGMSSNPSLGISKEGALQAAINRGIKAAEATGIPSGAALKAGSFGISAEGKAKAEANKAEARRKEAAAKAAKAKAASDAKKAADAKAKAAAEGKTKAQQAAAARKATGTSTSQAKAANQASMRAAAAARHAQFKKDKAAGTHARGAAAQRAAKRNAAKTRAKNAAKARNKAKKSKKSGGGCPDPNMFILMANGSQKRAGDLMVGDLIKTNHEKDLKLGEYKVEYVNVLNNRQKAKFTFDESVIVCSLTHKFYVDNDWKEAKDMVIGDEVSGQKLISIESVEDGDVIHITVEDAHTYICEGLLSHNKRCDIRSKCDISPLINNDLKQDACDDLADVAYFVRALKEV